MKRWWLLLVLLLSLGTNIGILATLALAPSRSPRPPVRPLERPPNVGPLADRLGLEGERREQFLHVQQEFFETVRTTLPRLHRLRRQLHREMVSERPDRRRLDELLVQVGETQVTLERALVHATLESREFLTREQRRHYFRFLSQRIRAVQQNQTRQGQPRRRQQNPAGRPPASPGEGPPRPF